MAIILSVQANGATGGFIETVQESQERCFSRTAGTDDRQSLAAKNLKRRVFYKHFLGNAAAEILGTENRSITLCRSIHERKL